MSKNLLSGSLTVSALTLLSRAFGFIWNLLLAKVFGAGIYTDVFFVAYRVPNLLRSFFAEGALTSAFVPVFADDLAESKDRAQTTLAALSTALLITTAAISLLSFFCAPQIVSLLAPGFTNDPKAYDLAVTLTKITLPYIMFVSQIALLNGALTNLRIFGAAAVAQITMNIVLIAGTALASLSAKTETAVMILTWSVLVGGLMQLLSQYPALRKAGLVVRLSGRLFTTSTKQVYKLMLPAIFGSAVYQLNSFINTILASFLLAGSISWLFYAERISQLPIGIVTIAISSVLLPELARALAANDQAAYKAQISASLRYTAFLISAAAIFLFVLAEPLVSLLFERGSFSGTDANLTGKAIMALAPGLVFLNFNTILNRIFLAEKDTRTPAVLALINLSFNLFFALLLMGRLDSAASASVFSLALANIQETVALVIPLQSMGHVGLALASSIAALLTFISSISYLQFRNRLTFREFSGFVSKSFLIGLLYALLLMAIKLLIGDRPLITIATALMVSPIFYYLAGRFFKSEEITATYLLLFRKLKHVRFPN